MVNKKVIRFPQKLTTPVSNKYSNLCPLGTHLLEINLLHLNLQLEIENLQKQVVNINQDELNLL